MDENLPVRGITRDIMKALKISDVQLALRVEDEMTHNVDFSECTQREFNLAAREAFEIVMQVRS